MKKEEMNTVITDPDFDESDFELHEVEYDKPAEPAPAASHPAWCEAIANLWRKAFPQDEFAHYKNATDHDMSCTLYLGFRTTSEDPLIKSNGHPITHCRLTLKPGEQISLPASLGNALRTIRAGKVVGGLLPQVTRLGGENYPLDSVLVIPRGFRPGLSLKQEMKLFELAEQKEIDALVREVE